VVADVGNAIRWFAMPCRIDSNFTDRAARLHMTVCEIAAAIAMVSV
jgi:hypothetical protein